MSLLAETFSTTHWLLIGLTGAVLVGFIFIPGLIALIRMNTTQHVHRQKLNNDDRRIEWCEEQVVNASKARNNMKSNQRVLDAKLSFMIRQTPQLAANCDTGMFDAIDAEPEKPIVPLPKGDFS